MLTGLSPNRDDGGVKLVGEGRDAGAAGLDPGLESVELARLGEGRPYRDPRRASPVGPGSLLTSAWAKAPGDGHDGARPQGPRQPSDRMRTPPLLRSMTRPSWRRFFVWSLGLVEQTSPPQTTAVHPG